MVVDEAHRLKNNEGKLYDVLKVIRCEAILSFFFSLQFLMLLHRLSQPSTACS